MRGDRTLRGLSRKDRAPDPEDPLVLVVKGDLVQRYPGLIICAATTKLENGLRVPRGTPTMPDFVGVLEPDVLLAGFTGLTAEDVWALEHGNDPDAKVWFFFAEHFSEPRFGLDDTTEAPGAPTELERRRLAARPRRRVVPDTHELRRLAAEGRRQARHLRLGVQRRGPGVDHPAVPVPPRHPGEPAASSGGSAMTELDQWRERLATGRVRLREAEDLTARTRWALAEADGQLAERTAQWRRRAGQARGARAGRRRARARRRGRAAAGSARPARRRAERGGRPAARRDRDRWRRPRGRARRRRPGGADRAVPGAAGDPLRRPGRGAGAAGADLPRRPPRRRPRARPQPGGGHLRAGVLDRRTRRGGGGRGLVDAVGAAGPLPCAVGARAAPARQRRRSAHLPRGHPRAPPGPRARRSPARCPTSSWSASGRAPGRRRCRGGPSRTPSRSDSTWPASPRRPRSRASEPTELGDDVVVLGEDARWLSDFAAAVEAGMAVEVPLPARTTEVTDVVVAGVCLSLAPDDAGSAGARPRRPPPGHPRRRLRRARHADQQPRRQHERLAQPARPRPGWTRRPARSPERTPTPPCWPAPSASTRPCWPGWSAPPTATPPSPR